MKGNPERSFSAGMEGEVFREGGGREKAWWKRRMGQKWA